MEVQFTPEQQAGIAQAASKAGTVPERLVTNVVVRYLAEEARAGGQHLNATRP